MRRTVVKTERYIPERAKFGAFGIIDTLECGHTVYHKGSTGYANYRECRECQDWLEGHNKYKSIGDKEEKWNPETQMPYWEVITR